MELSILKNAFLNSNDQLQMSLVVFISYDFCCRSKSVISKLIEMNSTLEIPITIINLPLMDTETDSSISGHENWNIVEKDSSLVLDLFRHFCVDTVPSASIIDLCTFKSVSINCQPSISRQITEDIINFTNIEINSNGKSPSDYVQEARNAFDNGALVEAASLFSLALALDDNLVDASYNLGVIAHTCCRPLLAIPHLKKVILSDPSDRTCHSVLGGVIGELEPAATSRAYRQIVELQPTNLRAVHMLACLEGGGDEGSDPAYVAQVFDELADTFEDKLVNHLEYRVPWLLLEMMDQHLCTSARNELSSPLAVDDPLSIDLAWRVLDLGCGSGLCGRLFKKYTVKYNEANAAAAEAGRSGGKMIGVDLSSKMIKLCEEEGSYDALYVEDIHDTIRREEDGSVDLILSADTFIYVGDLQKCFELSHPKLVTSTGGGGYMAFSVETLSEGTFKLRRSGRYGHSETYIEELASRFGFDIINKQPIVVRKESGDSIPGHIYLLQKSATNDARMHTMQIDNTLDQLSVLLGDVRLFIDTIDSELSKKGFSTEEYEMDHICFRCETDQEYNELCLQLTQQGHVLTMESMVGGRMISIFALRYPILYAGHSISCLEIPAPKVESYYPRGLEHAELVVNEHPLSFGKKMNEKFKSDVFNLESKSSKKKSNPDVSIAFKDTVCGDITVKFHELPIYKVVEIEKKNTESLRIGKES